MTLNLLITVDVDQDGANIENERTSLSWGCLEQIPAIKQIFRGFDLYTTWFVRADNQLETFYGSPAYLLLAYNWLWKELAASGDEIAWHPHIYRRTNTGEYRMETDEHRFCSQLTGIRADLKREGFEHLSVRVGEAFGTNLIMRTLAGLGLKADSSAIPGRRRADSARTFDWALSPNQPYVPDVNDYRVPAVTRGLSIVEVPMTTAPIQAPYDKEPLLRYMNLSYRHPFFKQAVEAYLTSVEHWPGDTYFTLIVHPDEVMPERPAHPLYEFSLASVERNLNYLLEAIASRGMGVRSLAVRTVPEFIALPTWERSR